MMNIITQEEINEIHDLCEEHNIGKYTINSDGTIDVDGDVYLSRKGLTILPLRFNKVSGYFSCSFNNLTSLEYCPKEVGGNFHCSYNKLTSLEGSPESVGGDFYCNYNKLTSLEFSPKSVGGDFYCRFNKLSSLEFSPKEVGGHFYCNDNELPLHFKELYNILTDEEIKIFVKYQNDLRIWDDGYDQEEAQLLYEEIKDGLL